MNRFIKRVSTKVATPVTNGYQQARFDNLRKKVESKSTLQRPGEQEADDEFARRLANDLLDSEKIFDSEKYVAKAEEFGSVALNSEYLVEIGLPHEAVSDLIRAHADLKQLSVLEADGLLSREEVLIIVHLRRWARGSVGKVTPLEDIRSIFKIDDLISREAEFGSKAV